MNITDVSIRNPVFAWMLMACTMLFGIIALTRKQMLQGVALIVVGLLIGPGGVSIFT